MSREGRKDQSPVPCIQWTLSISATSPNCPELYRKNFSSRGRWGGSNLRSQQVHRMEEPVRTAWLWREGQVFQARERCLFLSKQRRLQVWYSWGVHGQVSRKQVQCALPLNFMAKRPVWPTMQGAGELSVCPPGHSLLGILDFDFPLGL